MTGGGGHHGGGRTTTRPERLVVVAGTGTEIGKTWVTCQLAAELRAAGRRVAARKPAQSFEPADVALRATDAQLLAAATGESPRTICPSHRWYEVPMAPFMAADVLGRPRVLLDDLLAELDWPDGVEVGFVEPAGGVRSPMGHDGADTVALTAALAPDHVVLVADAGLGTLNAVRLCCAALDGFPVLVFLNRYDSSDELHRRNRSWLEAHGAAPVVTDIADLASRLG